MKALLRRLLESLSGSRSETCPHCGMVLEESIYHESDGQGGWICRTVILPERDRWA